MTVLIHTIRIRYSLLTMRCRRRLGHQNDDSTCGPLTFGFLPPLLLIDHRPLRSVYRDYTTVDAPYARDSFALTLLLPAANGNHGRARAREIPAERQLVSTPSLCRPRAPP